jgi:tetratricopeptide (TPR) repeat protein
MGGSPGAQVPIWFVPYRRNPFFTGQEDILTRLRTALTVNKTAALTQQATPQALSGLGGIGKTQIALEYAYRYNQEYQAVLWTQADSREALVLSYSKLASLLHLPEKDATDKSVVVEAVKQWLATHNHWLLILDNADEIALVDDFLPEVAPGHVLLTTRAQAHGTLANGLAVQEMEPAEGALLLLRRAKVLAGDATLEQAPGADRTAALELAKELGGLPLALDQAGAYIEETGCGIEGYRQRYQRQQTTLLKRRGKLVTDHPEPVATTWLLSFTKVEELNRAAADLLRLCAFMHADAIPEELLAVKDVDLGPDLGTLAEDPIALDDAWETLSRYSFVRRNAGMQALSIHRLVQAVLRDAIGEEQARQWAERAVKILSDHFPYPKDLTMWARCERYILHAQVCAGWIAHWHMTFGEAAFLLNQAAYYLNDHAQYEQAEPLYERALAIREEVLGSKHPDTARSINNLAALYDDLGKYDEAEPLYERALAIREEVLGPKHPDTANSLSNLATLYNDQGKYEEAEPLLKRAITIREEVLGPKHSDTAFSLNNLAYLYEMQGKYEEAKPLYERALVIFEEVLGPTHPNTIVVRQNYATLLQELQRGK